jgi:hypothetical protein
MPFIVKQIEEVKPQEVVTADSNIDPFVGFYILLTLVVVYLLRDFLKDMLLFFLKIGVVTIFGFISYTLFLT